MNEIRCGDCLNVMAGMEENSVHSIVCDPPYELTSIVKRFGKEGSAPAKQGTDGRYARLSKGFMGKSWDGTGIGMRPEVWEACLRVAKPGAYLLAFGGTRTFHRLACAIEDAGWTLRDTLSWNYGSGFPKSKNIALSIDKGEGHPNRGRAIPTASHLQNASDKHLESNPVPEYEAKSEAAKDWQGFGTALKPAWEPILLFQKPVEGTYAENILKWGCGALNIDGCRIGATDKQLAEKYASAKNAPARENSVYGKDARARSDCRIEPHSKGRWPANFLLSHTIFCEKVGIEKYKNPNYDGESIDSEYLEREAWNCVPDCPVRMLDEQSGTTKSTGGKNTPNPNGSMFGIGGGKGSNAGGLGDTGGSSRFFYCAKASREERNAGLEAVHTLFEKREGKKSDHPTVKPIALMRYLCRLVTPPAGTVLDPFGGSGSTGCAAILEGFQAIIIEKEKEYAEIARARMAHFSGRMP